MCYSLRHSRAVRNIFTSLSSTRTTLGANHRLCWHSAVNGVKHIPISMRYTLNIDHLRQTISKVEVLVSRDGTTRICFFRNFFKHFSNCATESKFTLLFIAEGPYHDAGVISFSFHHISVVIHPMSAVSHQSILIPHNNPYSIQYIQQSWNWGTV